MISKWHWTIVQLSRQLWMRAVLFALLAAATALATLFFKELIPPDLSGKIGAHAVDKILNILASGMLVVTTFSLSVMVAAYSSATSSISPRATRLLMEDSTTQNVLATFVGSFLYSLIGITALNAGIYDDEGQVILFIVTLGVIVLIVATMLLWIEHLSHLGRVGETNDRIEKATLKAVLQRAKYPWLGGSPLDDPTLIPQQAQAIYSTEIGYVQYIDIAAISRWAEEAKARVYIVSVQQWLITRLFTFHRSDSVNCLMIFLHRSPAMVRIWLRSRYACTKRWQLLRRSANLFIRTLFVIHRQHWPGLKLCLPLKGTSSVCGSWLKSWSLRQNNNDYSSLFLSPPSRSRRLSFKRSLALSFTLASFALSMLSMLSCKALVSLSC